MENNNRSRKKEFPAWIVLTVIALLAGAALGFTNMKTADRITEQQLIAAEEARAFVMPAADSFNELELKGAVDFDALSSAHVDYCYEATAGTDAVGHVLQVTVAGYGGDIEVTVGLDAAGAVTGVSVGGANFSETAGLGAKTKDAAFTAQFAGMQPEIKVDKDGGDVDSVTGATKSSRAVTNAVNAAYEYVNSLK